ncbi:hypothetical protein LL033_25705 (plasmid) [Clostridium estertheticum]|uniref:hypothetical protein n=1 Tax=Clostridium estertheticum TaxID=238834 RepID=UPI001C0D5FA5|nr:hypothetical protein [Clostridium estertheticum]MBU3217379.1 hypothetical protein [Clostridium estertheticum]WAG58155.1 hypothetical protein LL033_25705 [Clostridium estertheticum]
MKKQDHQQFENIIKVVLADKAEKISTPDNMFENIKHEIEFNRSEEKFMLKEKFLPLNFKKSIIVACCSIFIVTGSVLTFSPGVRASALQSIDKYVNGYTDMKRYDRAPSKDELKQNLGYEAKMPASLEGDYKLIRSHILGHVDGLIPDKQYDKRGAAGIYSKDNNKENYVSLDLLKVGAGDDTPIFKNAKAVTIGNTAAYWVEYKIHIVPQDIMDKKTKKEKNEIDKACESGKEILINVGSNDNRKLNEEFKTAHSLKWADNKVNYQLTDENNKLTFKEMSKMAEGIINSK